MEKNRIEFTKTQKNKQASKLVSTKGEFVADLTLNLTLLEDLRKIFGEKLHQTIRSISEVKREKIMFGKYFINIYRILNTEDFMSFAAAADHVRMFLYNQCQAGKKEFASRIVDALMNRFIMERKKKQIIFLQQQKKFFNL